MTAPHHAFDRHHEQSVVIPAPPEAVFEKADDHAWLAGHMAASSWMMGGGTMTTSIDEGRGQVPGSHITMVGRVLGISLFLDEVVTERVPSRSKTWETVGTPRLLVIGAYRMGFRLLEEASSSRFTMFIDYDLPPRHRWIGVLLAGAYARWCVSQMVSAVSGHFRAPQRP